MKKSIVFIMGLLILMVVLGNTSFVAAEPEPWVPDEENVPGFDHYMGTELTANDSIAFTGVDYIRIDFWTIDDEFCVVTITIENETNIFDQQLPEDVKNKINEATDGMLKIETLWDFLKIALPVIAKVDDSLKTKKLTSDDFYFIDEGIAIYNSDFTLALVKDQGLAIIAMNLPYDKKPASQEELDNATNAFVQGVNDFINYASGGVITTEETNEPEIDENVILVIDRLSFQYGDNDNSPKSVLPGYPIMIFGIVSIFAIIYIMQKKRTIKER